MIGESADLVLHVDELHRAVGSVHSSIHIELKSAAGQVVYCAVNVSGADSDVSLCPHTLLLPLTCRKAKTNFS